MSCVLLIAADRPLPLCDRQEMRTSFFPIGGGTTVSFLRGFQVAEHRYYRSSVDALGYTMKPFLYELSLEVHQTDLLHLKEYLAEHLAPGDEVELWNLWVGNDRPPRLPRYRGRLAEFDLDTLAQLCDPPAQDGLPGQCAMTVTI